MKRIFRHFIIDTYCLYLASLIGSGMNFGKGTETLILSGVAITIVSLLAKPIINILLLPINLVTFGLFRWVASSVILYLTSLIVPAFKILFFDFSGFSSKWIDIPNIHFEGIMAYIAFSFILSFLTSFIYWLVK